MVYIMFKCCSCPPPKYCIFLYHLHLLHSCFPSSRITVQCLSSRCLFSMVALPHLPLLLEISPSAWVIPYISCLECSGHSGYCLALKSPQVTALSLFVDSSHLWLLQVEISYFCGLLLGGALGQQRWAVKATETRTGRVSGAGGSGIAHGEGRGLRLGHAGGHCRTINAGSSMWAVTTGWWTPPAQAPSLA